MARRLRGIQFDSPDEREVFHAKESWIPVVMGAIPYLVIGVAGWLLARTLLDQANIGLMVFGIAMVAAVLTRIPRIIANLDTDVIITNRRLYARTGIINIKDQVCDLANVSDVTVDPTVLGRLFDYADVRIQTFAGDQDFELKGIAHAYDMRSAISRGSDANRQGRPRPTTPHQHRRSA